MLAAASGIVDAVEGEELTNILVQMVGVAGMTPVLGIVAVEPRMIVDVVVAAAVVVGQQTDRRMQPMPLKTLSEEEQRMRSMG